MLYAGDDWAEDHHDIALVDAAGRRLAQARLGEGVAGIVRFHELIAEHAAGGEVPARGNSSAPSQPGPPDGEKDLEQHRRRTGLDKCQPPRTPQR